MYALWQFFFERLFRAMIAETDTTTLPKEPFILASNHIDWLDGLLLAILVWPGTHRKLSFLTRTGNWWIFGSETIRVTQSKEKVAKDIHQQLRKGNNIGVFVEGYRNPEPDLAKGKVGAIRFAIETGTQIVPVGIHGESHPSMFASLRNLRSNPPRFFFGKPRSYKEYAGRQDDKQLLDTLTAELMVEIGTLAKKSYPYA